MAAMSASVGTHLEVAHTCVSAAGLNTTMQELVALQQYLRGALQALSRALCWTGTRARG